MNILVYLLQVTACTTVFYLFYYLLLNRLTFFVTNRWYLLITLIISFVIPFLTIKTSEPHVYVGVVQQVVYEYAPQTVIINQPMVQQPLPQSSISWIAGLKIIYLLAVLALIIHLGITLIAFFKRVKGKHIAKIGKVNVLSGNPKITNGSFLNYIFLNDAELSADEVAQIIAHELLHVKLYHSADRIIVKIAQIVLWFNPFVYLYARSVEENHEFEVDREVARSTDKHNYANLLLHLSVAGQGMLYHNFSTVPLKKRITMLFNQPSNHMKKVIYVLVAPVLLISCLAFARLKNTDDQISAIDGVEKLGKNPLVIINGKVYKKDILYRISPSCIKGMGIFDPNANVIKHGVRIKDGYIDITTLNSEITNITSTEKENLVWERAVPKTQFYSRIHLKKEDGTIYDKAIVHVGKGMVTCGLKPDDKAAFLINKKLYTESEIQHISPAIVASLSGEYGVEPAIKQNFPGIDVKGYKSVFTFKTDRDDVTDSVKYRQKIKRTPERENQDKKNGNKLKSNQQSNELKQQQIALINLHKPISVSANDSTYFDKKNQLSYLYGKAHVIMGEFECNADYIKIDEKNHQIFASGRVDPKTNRYSGWATSNMGDTNQNVVADSILFNYQNNKGTMWKAHLKTRR